MAFTLRSKSVAGDNIKQGSPTGAERTIAGTTKPPEVYGGGTNIKQGVGGAPGIERHILGSQPPNPERVSD